MKFFYEPPLQLGLSNVQFLSNVMQNEIKYATSDECSTALGSFTSTLSNCELPEQREFQQQLYILWWFWEQELCLTQQQDNHILGLLYY